MENKNDLTHHQIAEIIYEIFAQRVKTNEAIPTIVMVDSESTEDFRLVKSLSEDCAREIEKEFLICKDISTYDLGVWYRIKDINSKRLRRVLSQEVNSQFVRNWENLSIEDSIQIDSAELGGGEKGHVVKMKYKKFDYMECLAGTDFIKQILNCFELEINKEQAYIEINNLQNQISMISKKYRLLP